MKAIILILDVPDINLQNLKKSKQWVNIEYLSIIDVNGALVLTESYWEPANINI